MNVFDKKEIYNITCNLRMTDDQCLNQKWEKAINRTTQKDETISNAMYIVGREEKYFYIVE